MLAIYEKIVHKPGRLLVGRKEGLRLEEFSWSTIFATMNLVYTCHSCKLI
jgi:hypothetical protein